MKDALGHGSDPRGVAAHQTGVDSILSDKAQEHLTNLTSNATDNEKFDAAIANLRADRSITKDHMRQIAAGYLGHDIKAAHGREMAIQRIKQRQALNQRSDARASVIDAWNKPW